MALENAAPKGYHNVHPYLVVDDAAAAIAFYTQIFGARERMRMPGPNNRIMHAELEFGDTCVMLADENPSMPSMGPKHFGGSPVTIMLYVPDVDHVHAQAIAAGATSLSQPADQFYGDRSGGVQDPFGHKWYIATHVRDVSPEELRSAMDAMAAQHETAAAQS